MSKPKFMRLFAKWHIWLGWLVGVPILMWTVTGLIMVWQPIDYVHGDHLRTNPPADVSTELLVMPQLPPAVRSVTLQSFADGPGWIVVDAEGSRTRHSALNGLPYRRLEEAGARRIAEATFAGDAVLEQMSYFPADQAPMDLRRPVDSWQARFADGTHIYVAAQTGEVLALRSGWWRVFDFVWGLHIMDLQTREDTSHPILILFAGLGVIGSLLGCVLMFRRRKARIKAQA